MDDSKLEAIKKQVRSVLISAKDGLSLKEFSSTYKDLLGSTLPYKEFGYHTYLDFLHSLTDVVHVQVDGQGTVQLYGIADDATKHIQKLVSRQRSNPKKNVGNVPRFTRNVTHTQGSKGRTFVPALLRGELIMLLKSYPNGISYSSLVMAYKKIYGKELNLEWLSKDQDEKFKKLAEVIPEIELESLHGQLKLFHKDIRCMQDENELDPSTDFQLQQRKEKVLNCDTNATETEERNLYSSAIPDSIKSNFVKVLKLYPEGILAVHFPIAYEMIIKQPLDIFELSYTSLLEIADALPDIFCYYKNPNKNNEWVFKFAEFPNESLEITNLKSSDQNCKPIHQKFSNNLNRNECLDIADHSLPFDVEKFPSDSFSKFFPVYVSAVINPSLFWVQIKTEEAKDRHAMLEKEMNEFYDENSFKYKMKDAHITVGASCVAFSKSDDHWYRAEIVAIPNVEFVKVTFVDYGGTERIPKSNLYYLKNEFKIMPKHAHKAQLAGVEPTEHIWGTEAQERFLELTNTTVIMAKIESVEGDTVSLYLCDTREGKNIHINDTLESEGYAKLSFSNDGICSSPVKNVTLGTKEVSSSSHNSHNQANGKIASEQFLHTNGIKEQNGFGNRSLPNGKTSEKEPIKRRFVKRVYLGEGYTIHIIAVADSAYVSGGDLCNLFWADKDADVLTLKLKFKGVSIPMITVSDDSNSELFDQCRRYSVKGFQEAGSETMVKLCPLKCVVKILNTFGHPSAQLRETLVEEMKNLDLHNTFWKEYRDLEEEVSDITKVGNKSWNNLCLYDLTAMHTGLEHQRLRLVKESSESNNAIEIKKIESRQRNIKKRMDEISLICNQYAS